MYRYTPLGVGIAFLLVIASCGSQTETPPAPAAQPAGGQDIDAKLDGRLSALEKMIETMERNPDSEAAKVPLLVLSAAQVHVSLAKHQRTESSGDLERLLASDNARERAAGARVRDQLQAERRIFDKLTSQLAALISKGHGTEELREMARLREVRRALKAMPPELAAYADESR